MTRRVPLAAAAVCVLALALSPPAQAKGIMKVVVCGADGCSDVTATARDEALLDLGPAAGGPTARGPGFVRVLTTIGDGRGEGATVRQLYVPARDLVATREDGGGWIWTSPLPDTTRALRDATRGVRTIPARRLPAAAVATGPAPAPAPAKVASGGAGGAVPAWAWPAGGLLALLLGAGAARGRRGRSHRAGESLQVPPGGHPSIPAGVESLHERPHEGRLGRWATTRGRARCRIASARARWPTGSTSASSRAR